MDSLAALLGKLQEKGSEFYLDAGGVRYRAPRGVINSEDFEYLRRHREELLNYVGAREAARPAPFSRHNGGIAPSFVQEMWWDWIDKSRSLVIPIVEHLEGVSPRLVIEALKHIVQCHDVLRYRFTEDKSGLAVSLNNVSDFPLETKEFNSVVGLNDEVQKFASQPLPADSRWLVKGAVFHVTGYGSVAVLVKNHIVSDGGSVTVIQKQIRDYIAGTTSIDRTAPQHADFVHWQRKWFQPRRELLTAYWRNWITAKPNAVSPTGRKPLCWAPGSKREYNFSIPARIHLKLQALCSHAGCSTFIGYLTAFSLAISKWSGINSFPLRSMYDERIAPVLEPMVGLMTSADAIGIEVDHRHEFQINLKEVRNAYLFATAVRIPTMYAVSPDIVGRTVKIESPSSNIGIVINYRDVEAMQGKDERVWPPNVTIGDATCWPHSVSAVALSVGSWRQGASVRFYLHDDILTTEEQRDLVRSFCEEMGKIASERINEPLW